MDKATFINIFSELSFYEKLDLFNLYCEDANINERLYSTDEFDELESGRTPSEIVGDCADGFDLSDDFMYLDGYGHWVSLSNFGAEDFIDDYADDIFLSDVWCGFSDKFEETDE